MYQRIPKPLISGLLAVLMLFTTALVRAQDTYQPQRQVSSEAMVADVLLLRPAGIAATAVGTAVFIISLPFALITGSTEQAAQALVMEPARYTFVRPLGQFDDYSY